MVVHPSSICHPSLRTRNSHIYLLHPRSGVNSGARASTMRGRLGVTFQGRGFESHIRGIQFYFQRKRGKTGPKIFAFVIMKTACCPMARLSIFGSRGLGFDPRRLRFYNFWFSYLIFAFRREVVHLASPGLTHLGRLGSIRIHHFFNHLVFPDEKKCFYGNF